MQLRSFRILLALSLTTLFSFVTMAQTFTVNGAMVDSTDGSEIIGAYVRLIPVKDTSNAKIVVTDINGKFEFKDVTPQTYLIKATYLSYRDYMRTITVTNQDVPMGNLLFSVEATMLKEVKIEGQALIATQKGDTTQFNASAFKTNQDATTEELISKMPGITVTNGTVTAQGQTVQRVLVDGKPFFGDDATLALRNLPAEIVDKIEVFDRQTEQAQFTGFDDGNAQKTINIVTRADRNRGQFGKIYAGYGTDDRYSAGGSVNMFGKGHRLSLLGLANNINQQNFSSQDIAGVLGNSGGGGGGRGGRGGGGGNNNFMVGQQSGISNTTAFGLNYTGNWSEKTEVSGSYFFNRANNLNNTSTNRQTFLRTGNQFYQENSTRNNLNFNNRFNMRLEHKFNKSNSILYTPSFSWQNNQSNTARMGLTTLEDASKLNETSNERYNHTGAFNINNSLLYRHAFAKVGRTLSINANANVSNRNSDGTLYSKNIYYVASRNPSDTIDQQSQAINKGIQLGTNINYTEPLGKSGQLQLGYNLSINNNNSNSETYNYVEQEDRYSRIDSVLSNNFDNRYITQRAGASYRVRNQTGLMFAVGFDLQSAGLYSQQLFPGRNKVDQTFTNVLPNMMLNYRNNKTGKNFRVFYRSSTQQPSISQLQNVINNSNPLFLSAGNPDLKQELGHNLNVRYSKSSQQTGSNFFVALTGNTTSNYITNSTLIAEEAMDLGGGLYLERGAQLTRPVNIKNGTKSMNAFINYGFPVKPLKINLNVNGGGNYRRTPGLINNLTNISNNYALSQGIVLSSNFSTKLDFSISFNGNYNIVKNSIQQNSNNNYFTQSTGARVTWLFGKGFVLASDISNSSYRGLGEGFNQSFNLWNASFGKKFLKNNRGELKLMIFDILKQNNSISRSVTETYQEDGINRVLTQYAMLSFTYTLRNFGAPQTNNRQQNGDFPRREGGFPGGGGGGWRGGGGGGFPGN